MDQPKEKDKDDKKPAIPTLKDTTQRPQLKIKGLKAGQSILERLKQFKKKDLAFILAGLGVLFMAPLAEHFLMSPDNGDTFKEGWNVKPGAGGLGSGGSPFEPGAGGVAPGDLAGGGSDVITPLNVRDPSALIMGPGATAQPPAMTSNAGQAPKENSDWKDALSQSAARAAGAASRAATPLPPLPQLSGGGLRGLGAVSGGGGASYSLPAISAGNVPNKGGGGGSLGLAKAAPGYAGPAGARSLTNGGSLDALKAAAAKAGNDFNRPGAAASALEAAASRGMGNGNEGGGAGQGGPGMGSDKGVGQNQNKNAKTEGESLAFLAAKENQEKSIDLKWKLIEKKAMLWPDLREKMTEELVMSPTKKLAEKIGDMVGSFIGGKDDHMVCDVGCDSSGQKCQGPFASVINKSDVGDCIGGEGKDHKWCWDVTDPAKKTICNGQCSGNSQKLYNCTATGGGNNDDSHKPTSTGLPTGTDPEDAKGGLDHNGNGKEVAVICGEIAPNGTMTQDKAAASGGDVQAKVVTDGQDVQARMAAYANVRAAAQALAHARYLLEGKVPGGDGNPCGIAVDDPSFPIQPTLTTAHSEMAHVIGVMKTGVIASATAALGSDDKSPNATIKGEEGALAKAVGDDLTTSGKAAQDVQKLLDKYNGKDVSGAQAAGAQAGDIVGNIAQLNASLAELTADAAERNALVAAKNQVNGVAPFLKAAADDLDKAGGSIDQANRAVVGNDQFLPKYTSQLTHARTSLGTTRQNQQSDFDRVSAAVAIADAAGKENMKWVAGDLNAAFRAGAQASGPNGAAQPAHDKVVSMLPQQNKDSSFVGQLQQVIDGVGTPPDPAKVPAGQDNVKIVLQNAQAANGQVDKTIAGASNVELAIENKLNGLGDSGASAPGPVASNASGQALPPGH